MKKIKYCVLSLTALLALSGCNSKKVQPGELPKGGDEIDISTDEGKDEVIEKSESGIEETYKSLDNVKVTTELGKTNADINASIDLSMIEGFGLTGQGTAEVTVKDLTGKAVSEVNGLKGTLKDSKMHESISDVNGEIGVKVNIPFMEGVNFNADETFKVKDVALEAWYSDNYVYVDASNKGLANVITNLDDVVSKLLGSFSMSLGDNVISNLVDGLIGSNRQFKVDVSEEVSSYTDPIIPELNEESLKEYVDELKALIDSVSSEESPVEGLTFLNYSDGRFGVQVKYSGSETFHEKEDTTVDEEITSTTEVTINETSATTAAILFNKAGVLDTVSFTLETSANATYVVDGKTNTVSAEFSTSATNTFSYNNIIELPDFSNYQLVSSLSD